MNDCVSSSTLLRKWTFWIFTTFNLNIRATDDATQEVNLIITYLYALGTIGTYFQHCTYNYKQTCFNLIYIKNIKLQNAY